MGFLPSSAAASIYLFKPPCAIGSVPSSLGHVVAYRWRSLPRVRRHRASKPQGSSKRVRYLGRSPCVCVCVFSPHSFWTSSDVPAGVTQKEGHTGFSIHLLSAVRALIFLARRIQPFLSLVDREVEFCVITIQSFSTRLAFLFFSEKNPVCRDRNHVPKCQKVTRLPLSYQLICASLSHTHYWYEVCFLPIHSGHQVRWTYQPGSHRISHPPSFCGACLNFSREKDSAISFPRRP